ncbi:MAG: hypothetical protein LUC50_08135 [Ruminococcus sp.]|nr:hypothetical protein [Ruminococcus sp.]
MSNWRQKLAAFMQGRYGTNDTLNKWLLGAFVVLLFLSIPLQNDFLNLLALLVLFYSYFRIFSKNIAKREHENQKFLELKARVVGFFKREKTSAANRRTHHIYRCPQCKQKVRVPKGHGTICITCPKCRNEFIKRS